MYSIVYSLQMIFKIAGIHMEWFTHRYILSTWIFHGHYRWMNNLDRRGRLWPFRFCSARRRGISIDFHRSPLWRNIGEFRLLDIVNYHIAPIRAYVDAFLNNWMYARWFPNNLLSIIYTCHTRPVVYKAFCGA